MQILRTVSELRTRVRDWKNQGAQVGLVPTMGALHEGHLSLVQAAQRGCDRVITSIFVNPAQFNNADDLAKYPRTEEQDAQLLARQGVDVLFMPHADEVYPKDFATYVMVDGVSLPLEGAVRPGHFQGVATVVAKLFGMTQADRAYFGEKDWQQLLVIKRLALDLNLPVEIVGCDTVREPDGLALSSRNRRLDALARARAPALYRIMGKMAQNVQGGMAVDTARRQAVDELTQAGFDRVDYLDICAAHNLEPLAHIDGPARLFAAAFIGGVRLIDNIAL